ncbi:MAG: hypothetical protein HKN25_04160 [Pyrinomonadaceae bacterium]|nr:hypothetical protein [Pyrinomonadaceae bacterium]
MSKTEKEIAFLYGLYVENEWKPKFSAIFDESFKPSKEETVLYVNAGAGDHALVLREKLDKDTQLFAVCETLELQKIAQAKSDAIKADIDFSTNLPFAESDLVVVDSSLVKPADLAGHIAEQVKLTKNEIAFFSTTSGSFGEIFSYLWEVLADLDLLEKGDEVENLISELPSDLKIEETLKELKLKKIKSKTKSEFFEFENGEEFINSPLMQFFLFPIWLKFLDDKEKEQVIEKLAQKIDDEHDQLSFRFSVKATLTTASKS